MKLVFSDKSGTKAPIGEDNANESPPTASDEVAIMNRKNSSIQNLSTSPAHIVDDHLLAVGKSNSSEHFFVHKFSPQFDCISVIFVEGDICLFFRREPSNWVTKVFTSHTYMELSVTWIINKGIWKNT